MKETDRLVALQNELEKIGCQTEITENSIKSLAFFEPKDEISIATYNDHRMATVSYTHLDVYKRQPVHCAHCWHCCQS